MFYSISSSKSSQADLETKQITFLEFWVLLKHWTER